MQTGSVIQNWKEGNLIDDLLEFIARGGLILGICNGFQLLAKLGLVPAFNNAYLQGMFL